VVSLLAEGPQAVDTTHGGQRVVGLGYAALTDGGVVSLTTDRDSGCRRAAGGVGCAKA
jgi:hypothetical protein